MEKEQITISLSQFEIRKLLLACDYVRLDVRNKKVWQDISDKLKTALDEHETKPFGVISRDASGKITVEHKFADLESALTYYGNNDAATEVVGRDYNGYICNTYCSRT